MRIVDALVLTGGTPAPDDPLRSLTRGGRKAWLPIAGKPMVQWVLDALEETREIRNVVIVGATPDDVGPARVKPRVFVADRGDMLANMFAGGAEARAATPPATNVLVVSSDIPAVTAEAIDWHVAVTRDSPHEAHFFLIPRDVIEGRFPNSGRTFVRLRDGAFVFGDVSLFALTLLRELPPAWSRLIAARKSVLAIARIVGLANVVLLLLGRLSLARCAARVRSQLGVDATAVVSPYAEAGMDVDKPRHYDLVAADLAARVARGRGR